MEILEYRSEHTNDVLAAIGNEPEWDVLSSHEKQDSYSSALANGISYVCYNDDEFCGYLRAILDVGFAIYISELLVVPKWRNKKIGQSLIERIKTDFPNQTLYVLSDQDEYYLKKGYKSIGSVFQI